MGIKAANEECIRRIQDGGAVWVDIRAARDVVPGMGDKTVFHAGPPLPWDRMPGPCAARSSAPACSRVGRRRPRKRSRCGGGRLRFDSSHHHRAIGPMSGIITPSMQVNVLRNEAFGLDTYATLYVGIGKVLRHGAYDETVMEKLRWMNHELAPLLRRRSSPRAASTSRASSRRRCRWATRCTTATRRAIRCSSSRSRDISLR
jgi:hypothetical protein